jgi:hypothetical protein
MVPTIQLPNDIKRNYKNNGTLKLRRDARSVEISPLAKTGNITAKLFTPLTANDR